MDRGGAMKKLRLIVGSEKTRRQGRIPRLALASPWLEKAGFHPGRKAEVFITEGRILILPKPSVRPTLHHAQALLGRLAEAVEAVLEILMGLHAELPPASPSMLAGERPYLIGPALKATLDNLIEEDLPPVLQGLHRGSAITHADLREEWQVQHFPPVRT
jgi:hypothetical protein